MAFCWLQCLKVKLCFHRSKYSHSQRSAVSAIVKSVKICATVTLMHAHDEMPNVVSRTAGQVALLLCVECSAEQAPVLSTCCWFATFDILAHISKMGVSAVAFFTCDLLRRAHVVNCPYDSRVSRLNHHLMERRGQAMGETHRQLL